LPLELEEEMLAKWLQIVSVICVSIWFLLFYNYLLACACVVRIWMNNFT